MKEKKIEMKKEKEKELESTAFNSNIYVRNRSATEPVILKVHNVKLSFDIWLVLYMYFILYF